MIASALFSTKLVSSRRMSGKSCSIYSRSNLQAMAKGRPRRSRPRGSTRLSDASKRPSGTAPLSSTSTKRCAGHENQYTEHCASHMKRVATIATLRADPAFAALARSLDVYYGNPAHDAAMDSLYARFARAGDLAFDIGAHVGDRIGSFRRLGARVVALEPQPLCARAIRAIYAGDDEVELVERACGAQSGTVTLRVNSANPTVSTASTEFVAAADGAGGWEGQ